VTPSWLRLGAVVIAEFPEHLPKGREQEGPRPAVLVGLPLLLGRPRFPMLLVAPVTTFRAQHWATGAPALYPVLAAGQGGLITDSVVLTDQLRALDSPRLIRLLGHLNPDQYAPIRSALRGMCEL
jgi:mRNA interferase MazF